MKLKHKNILFSLFFILSITLLGFFALKDSFRLTLFGDDWLVFWRYNYHLGAESLKEFNYFTYFLTVYGPEDMSLGIFQSIFHYNALPYFIVSFILRTLAAISIFPLVYSLTKDKLAGFIASLFFAISVIGIETTNWVFNMPSYLAIITLNFFLIILANRNVLSKKKLLLLGLLFYLTFIIQPIRMTGLPIITIIILLFWLLERFSFSTFKNIAIRVGIIVLAFLLVKFGGQSLGTSSEMVQRVVTGITTIVQQIGAGNIAILLNPFVILGSFFLPDILWNKLHFFRPGISMIISLYLPLLAVFTAFTALVYKRLSLEKNSRFFLIANLSGGIIWTLFVRFISKQDFIHLNDPYMITAAILGGYFIILMLTLLKHYFGKPQGQIILLALCVSLFSFIVPWLFTPIGVFSTIHRYLILSSMGIGLFWASMVYLFKKSKLIYLLLPFILVAFVFQIQANHFFFSQLVTSRGNDIGSTIWEQLSKDLPDIKNEKTPLVFYFAGDTTNSDTVNDAITFGFPPHIAVMYNVYHDFDRIPIPVANYTELEEIVMTGKPLNAHGRPQKPLPIEQIYAYKLEGRTKLINITKETRAELEKLKQSSNTE
jgi:hypothetical protein